VNAWANRRAAFLWAFLVAVLVGVVFPDGECAEARRSHEHVLTVVEVDELPREARETLALIKQGGPFPYKRDGVIFGNRERRLPARPSGYYREYTAPTPGARYRGRGGSSQASRASIFTPAIITPPFDGYANDSHGSFPRSGTIGRVSAARNGGVGAPGRGHGVCRLAG
jgi:guanyl-specific ribonuclease Sa